jgi:transcriptional regulator with XRE-family HTH domain
MSVRCDDFETSLRDDESAARAHAAACAACRERLAAWDEISALAPSLKQDWPTPALWPRIEGALAAEVLRPRVVAFPERWRPLALAASLALIAAAGYVVLHQRAQSLSQRAQIEELERKLLTERAVAAVERSEADYIASIDALAKLAAARLEAPATPLLASYREKLQILDAAIADCRGQIERNRFNAHLRGELLSIYREKQRTLQMLMDEKS